MNKPKKFEDGQKLTLKKSITEFYMDGYTELIQELEKNDLPTTGSITCRVKEVIEYVPSKSCYKILVKWDNIEDYIYEMLESEFEEFDKAIFKKDDVVRIKLSVISAQNSNTQTLLNYVKTSHNILGLDDTNIIGVISETAIPTLKTENVKFDHDNGLGSYFVDRVELEHYHGERQTIPAKPVDTFKTGDVIRVKILVAAKKELVFGRNQLFSDLEKNGYDTSCYITGDVTGVNGLVSVDVNFHGVSYKLGVSLDDIELWCLDCPNKTKSASIIIEGATVRIKIPVAEKKKLTLGGDAVFESLERAGLDSLKYVTGEIIRVNPSHVEMHFHGAGFNLTVSKLDIEPWTFCPNADKKVEHKINDIPLPKFKVGQKVTLRDINTPFICLGNETLKRAYESQPDYYTGSVESVSSDYSKIHLCYKITIRWDMPLGVGSLFNMYECEFMEYHGEMSGGASFAKKWQSIVTKSEDMDRVMALGFGTMAGIEPSFEDSYIRRKLRKDELEHRPIFDRVRVIPNEMKNSTEIEQFLWLY